MTDTPVVRQAVLPDGLLILSAGRLWSREAPLDVRTLARTADGPGMWQCWREHLARRKPNVDWRRWPSGGEHPLFWALPDAVRRMVERPGGAAFAALRGDARTGLDRRLTAWLKTAGDRGGDWACAFETLAWAYSLPRLAAQIDSAAWWRLVDCLLHVAGQAARDGGHGPLGEQLLGGELSLVLAVVLPEVAACRRAAAVGRRTLVAGRKRIALGSGLPHARHHAELRTLLACWTRARLLDERARFDRHYAILLRNALRLMRPDGAQSLCADGAGRWNPRLFAAATAVAGNDVAQRLAALRFPAAATPTVPRRKIAAPLPSPALLSREAATCVMRTEWNRDASQLTALFAGAETQVELTVGDAVVFSGPWSVEAAIDGVPLTPVSDWREIGWVSDKDVDYLELELCLQAGVRVQRHLLLARTDGFLYLADAILGAGAGRLDYCGRLPLAAGCRVRPAGDGRERFLTHGRRLALTMPLALPEWRSQPGAGELAGRGCLELRQRGADALFAPLFFDLDRRRLMQPHTWRQLTVGQDRRVLDASQAVGYRVQCGDRQWLLYRSLVRPANRTVLGHNLVSETLVGRFSPAGLVESLLEIEVAQTGDLLTIEPPHTRESHIGQE